MPHRADSLPASRKEPTSSLSSGNAEEGKRPLPVPPRSARPEAGMMTYDRTRPARPADVTMTLVATNAIVPAALVAPGAARPGRSADWAVTELYSLHHRGLVRLAVLLVRDVPTAEDVVQDSFVAMHDGWQRLRDAESALAYLRQAVLNGPGRCCGTGRGGKA